MEQSQKTQIDDVVLRSARMYAQRELDDPSDLVLDACMYVRAADRAGYSLFESLEAGLGVVLSSRRAPPIPVSSFEDVFSAQGSDSADFLAGVYSYARSKNSNPPSIDFGEKLYSRNPRTVSNRTLVGLDDQIYQLDQEACKLFMYDTHAKSNDDLKHNGLLLYGPPGTGKSSLAARFVETAQSFSDRSGTSFTYESFGSHDYSKWVGETSKVLYEKFSAISDARGVGLLLIEDIDMLLRSRNDESHSSGSTHVEHELMNFMSGVEQYRGNFLVLATSNYVPNIDEGVLRRFNKLEIPSFSSLEQYSSLVSSKLDWASLDIVSYVSQYSLERAASPARLTALCSFLDSYRRGHIDPAIFDLPPSERKAARESSFRSVCLDDIVSALEDFIV